MQLRRPLLRPRLRPLPVVGRQLLHGNAELRVDLPAFWNVNLAQVYGFTDAAELFTWEPSPGLAPWNHAASVGVGLRLGWLNSVSADLTFAKAIDGPRDDTRLFFALTGRY